MLLRHVLAKADAEQLDAYLENSRERNHPLCSRHGCSVEREITPLAGGPPLWLMRRALVPRQ